MGRVALIGLALALMFVSRLGAGVARGDDLRHRRCRDTTAAGSATGGTVMALIGRLGIGFTLRAAARFASCSCRLRGPGFAAAAAVAGGRCARYYGGWKTRDGSALYPALVDVCVREAAQRVRRQGMDDVARALG